jgi:hypothetical protein
MIPTWRTSRFIQSEMTNAASVALQMKAIPASTSNTRSIAVMSAACGCLLFNASARNGAAFRAFNQPLKSSANSATSPMLPRAFSFTRS